MDRSTTGNYVCRVCGRVHHAIALRVGERALCVDCGTTLARRRFSKDSALAFTITALVLTIPAAELPLVTVRKFGAERASYLWTGIRGLWQSGMPLLSVWVALCGVVVPLMLLIALAVIVASPRFGERKIASRFWRRLADALEHWSMPEVQVLAVLVAFVKIGALVDVEPGAGLWFYAAMTGALLLAWRSVKMSEVRP